MGRGTVNIIVWPSVADEQRRALRGSKLLSVQGAWQSEKLVNSLVALTLRDHPSCWKACGWRAGTFDEDLRLGG